MAEAYRYLYEGALIVLGLMLFPCLYRAARGPEIADRIIAVNMTGTVTIIIICLLALMTEEGYLVDIALIYAMLSFWPWCFCAKSISAFTWRERGATKMLEHLRFALCAALLIAGIMVEFSAVFGVHRFRYCMNRIHAAGMGDTLGIMLMLLSVIVRVGIGWTALKLLALIGLFWLTAPICSHLVGELVHRTDKRLPKEADEWKF